MPRRKPFQAGKPVVVFRSVGLDVRAEHWRKVSNLVENAQAIVNDVRFQQMLECLRTESPANFSFASSVKERDRAAHQARIEGYNACINLMLSLAQPWEDVSLPEPTFAPENAQPEP